MSIAIGLSTVDLLDVTMVADNFEQFDPSDSTSTTIDQRCGAADGTVGFIDKMRDDSSCLSTFGYHITTGLVSTFTEHLYIFVHIPYIFPTIP